MDEQVFGAGKRDRKRLRELPGRSFEGDELTSYLGEAGYGGVACVGDRVSIDTAEAGILADVCVVDGRIQREDIDERMLDVVDADIVLEVENPAGTISREGWNAVKRAFAHECRVTVRVEGEEDLLGLPAILFSPLGSAVVYGQWNRGAVVLEPDESLRGLVREMVGVERYEHMIVGGSWDRFHAGHRYLLLTAFERGERVDIGITSDSMLEEKLGHTDFWGYDRRRREVRAFLKRFGCEDSARLLRIDDFRGNAVKEGDALLVTDETRENGERINEERKERGMDSLELVEVERMSAEDGELISSSRIREGEIDGDGGVS